MSENATQKQSENTAQKQSKKGIFLTPLLAAFISVIFLAILLWTARLDSDFINVYNGHNSIDSYKCMYCGEPATRSVSAMVLSADIRPSEYYALNGRTYERTTTGYVPRKDTYLVLEEKNGELVGKIETERTWEEKTYSDGSYTITKVVGLYCNYHQYSGERLIKNESIRAQILSDPMVMIAAVCTVLPWIFALLFSSMTIQKELKSGDAARVEQGRKARKKTVITVSLAIAGLAAAFVAAQLILSGVESRQEEEDRQKAYQLAAELAEKKKYEEAAATFRALGSYQDSREQAQSTAYAQAEALLADGEYDEAASVFTDLGDYQDSAERAVNAGLEKEYAYALALLEEGQEHHVEARSVFESLGDYKDARERFNGFVMRRTSETRTSNGLWETTHIYLYNENGDISAVASDGEIIAECLYNEDGDLIQQKNFIPPIPTHRTQQA